MTRAALALAALAVSVPPIQGGETVVATIRAQVVPADGRFEPYPRWKAPSRPTIALALSGGGARGLAHVGVVQAMYEDGVEFDAVAGTSAGALVGGFLAAGFDPEEVESIIRGRRWNAIVSGLDLRTRVLSEEEDILRSSPLLTWRTGAEAAVRFGALVESRQLEAELYRYFLGAQWLSRGEFDRLRYRFRAVATDVRTGRKVAPSSGDMAALIRGSVAVPGVFAPYPYDGALLADGLLVENLPVDTARTLGCDLVLAVDVGEDVDPADEVRGTLTTLNRALNILMLEQVERARDEADMLIRPDVVGVSPGDFEANLDRLLEVGRSAYARSRDGVWRRLEEAAGDVTAWSWDAIEGPSDEPVATEELRRRLGASGSAGRFRLESELARLLNGGAWADGRVDVVESDGRRVLRLALVPNATLQLLVRDGNAAFGPDDPVPRPPLGEPLSWATVRKATWQVRSQLLKSGRILVHVDRVGWDPARGTLTATVSEPPFAGIEIVNTEGERLERLPRLFASLEGKPFRFDTVSQRLEDIEARGLIEGWRIEPLPADAGGVSLRAIVREDRHFEVAGSVAYRDTLGWAGLLRAGFTNLSGRGDTVELIGTAARDVAGIEGRYRSEFVGGFRNLGFESSVSWSDVARPLVGPDQEIVDDEAEVYQSFRLDAGLFKRVTFGTVLRAGLSRQRETLDAGAFGPAETRARTEVYSTVDLDRRDRLLFPSVGFALRWEGRWSLDGDPYRRNGLRLDYSHSFGALHPVTLSFRGAAGIAQDADRPAYWFDPGGFREVYGFLPYALQAPRYRQAGATARFRFLELGAVRSWVEIGADTLRIGYGDDVPGASGESVAGYGVSVTALARVIGPITVGWSRNDRGASVAFLTVGYPFVRLQ